MGLPLQDKKKKRFVSLIEPKRKRQMRLERMENRLQEINDQIEK